MPDRVPVWPANAPGLWDRSHGDPPPFEIPLPLPARASPASKPALERRWEASLDCCQVRKASLREALLSPVPEPCDSMPSTLLPREYLRCAEACRSGNASPVLL